MPLSLHWFRRDLRLTDNTALNAAATAGAEGVVPVYLLTTWAGEHRWTGPNRQLFLCDCLASLAGDLEKIGGRLIVRTGAAEVALERLLDETGAQAIYFNRDPDPFGRDAEDRVAAMAQRRGVAVFALQDVAMHERNDVLSGADKPYRVYSPYFKAWDKLPRRPPGPRLTRLNTPRGLASEPLPTLAHWKLAPTGAQTIEPGEAAARRRLDEFVGSLLPDYKVSRERVGDFTSSRFSQDLRWGLLSVRDILARCEAAAADATPTGQASIVKFRSEVAWRDFYLQILYHFPDVLEHEFNPTMRGLPWEAANGPAFQSWSEGRTGFPMVDAGMRQLAATGYMHNRLRMIVAMFLTKDLRIDWRVGEAFFMRQLVDGEIANNNGGWQWSAGVGADAAPFFRIQNPWMQSAKHDPDGEFIRRYVPELRDVPAEKLHGPTEPGVCLAKGYPAPMVEHGVERDRTLEMFKRHLDKAGA